MSQPADAISFDPLDPDFTRNPHPLYARMREQAPVYWWEQGQSFLITRHDDVTALQRDRRFSTDPRDWIHAAPPAAEGPAAALERLAAAGLLTAPPAEHLRLRRLINPAFTPRAAAAREDAIRSIIERTLDEAIRGGVVDVRRDFADPIPSRVIAHIFAIPEEVRPTFQRFSVSLLEIINPFVEAARLPGLFADFTEGRALLAELIASRRRELGDDLLSDLIRAEEAGDRLSSEELEALVAAMIIAGSSTTILALTFLVFTLSTHPAELDLVRRDPSLVGPAIEESLRYEPFNKLGTVPRFARQDVELRGVLIPRGSRVQLVLPAAMRDPEAFERPDVFDVRRDLSRAQVFGAGPHLCPGMHLARLELRIGLRALLDRAPTWRLLDAEPEFLPNPGDRDMARLRIALG